MEQDRWEALLGGALNNTLVHEEEQEFIFELQQDPAREVQLFHLLEQDELLSTLLNSAHSPESLEEQVRIRVQGRDGAAFVKAVLDKARSRSGPPPAAERRASPRSTRRRSVDARSPSGPWMIVLVAAGLLFAVLVLVTLMSSESDPNLAQKTSFRGSMTRERAQALAEAEAKRQEAEAGLREIQEKRRILTQTKSEQARDPQAIEKREKDLDALKRDQERIEQELREAAELAKRAERPAPAMPPQEEKPQSLASAPVAPFQGTTQAALAKVEEISGEAFVVTKEGKSPIPAGANLLPGQGLETGRGASRIVLRFLDKTRVDLGPDSVLAELKTDSGKHLALTQGTVRAIVAKQPKGEPLIFTTPHGQAKVVGTTLRLVVDPDPKKGTNLEVEEGKVELKNLAGKAVYVESGHYAVAAVGVELVARVLPSQKRLAYIFRQPQEAWCGVRQTVSLVPGQTYILSAWIRTTVPNSAQTWGQFPGGSIGVRTETGALVAQQPFGQTESYSRTVLTFKAGSNRTAILFAGFANGTNAITWMHVTEWSLTAKGGDGVNLVQDPNYEEQNPASAQLSSPWFVEGADPSQVRCAGQEPYRGRSPAPGGSEGERK